MPAIWGYARVSREDQALGLQLDALEAAGVPAANIVQEKSPVPGSALPSTPCWRRPAGWRSSDSK